MRPLKKCLDCQSGSSAIEFAFTAPVLLILVIGLADGWSLVNFVVGMRAGVGSAANLYLQGAGDDALVQATALENWQNRPEDASLVIERTYMCDGEVVGPDDLCAGSRAPSLQLRIVASGTWVAPVEVDFLGTRQTIAHEQTVRVR
jgi:hypothetical protein